MKIEEQVDTIKTYGQTESASFTIGQRGMVLLANLYENPNVAAPRELTQNAIDAHISTNQQRPIEITTPSFLFPHQLIIQDFGPGLSHDFMMNGYTIIFNSTKNDSNDFAGGFGVGRLSALAINDYMVESTQNYKTRFYHISNKNGVPTIEYVRALDNDNAPFESGFKVTVNVSKERCKEITKVCNMLATFSPVKIVVNNEQGSDFDYIMTGNGWRLVSSRETMNGFLTGSYESVIVCGGIPYKFTPALFDISSRLRYEKLVVDMPVGSIDFPPARDSVMVTAKSKKALQQRYAAIEAEVEAITKEKLTAFSTIWEKYFYYLSLPYGFFQNIISNIKLFGDLTFNSFQVKVPKDVTAYATEMSYSRLSSRKVTTLTPNKDTVIFIDDDNKVNIRLKTYLAGTTNKSVYRLSGEWKSFIDTPILKDYPNIVYASSIDITNVKSVSTNPSNSVASQHKGLLYLNTEKAWSRDSDRWEVYDPDEEDHPMDVEGVYCVLHYYKEVDNDITTTQLADFSRSHSVHIFAHKQSDTTVIEKPDELTTFKEFIDKKLVDLVNTLNTESWFALGLSRAFSFEVFSLWRITKADLVKLLDEHNVSPDSDLYFWVLASHRAISDPVVRAVSMIKSFANNIFSGHVDTNYGNYSDGIVRRLPAYAAGFEAGERLMKLYRLFTYISFNSTSDVAAISMYFKLFPDTKALKRQIEFLDLDIHKVREALEL